MKNVFKKIFTAVFCFVILTGCTKKAQKKTIEPEIIASTSWTAAFCWIAGIDNVEVIAPASLRHPPEYELTVSDIQKIQNGKYFVYAGFEIMMKTLGDAIGENSSVQMVQIKCTNDIENVRSQTEKLAEIFGTKDKWQKRIEQYEKTISDGKEILNSLNLSGAKVFCNKNQIFLAIDLGFNIAATFGPGPVTSNDIALAKNEDFILIIDNVHNPAGEPLKEVSNAKYIVWRNFPDNTEPDSLRKTIEANIHSIKN